MRWLCLSLLLLTSCVAEKGWVLNAEQGEPFVSVWKPLLDEATNSTVPVYLPLPKGFNYDFVVDWGDGLQSEITSADDPDRKHSYAKAGSYTVRISGLVEAWGYRPDDTNTDDDDYSNRYGYIQVITSVPELGDVGWKSLSSAFHNCFRLSDLRGGDVSQVTDMQEMFRGASSVIPDVSEWDTAKVTNMELTFLGADKANPDVSKWDTGNVTNMRYMFSYASAANPDVSKWDTGNVTNMEYMFSYASAANPDVSKWDISNVTDVTHMFSYATSANPDMSRWDFSKVTCYNNFLDDITLPTATYSNTLIRIAATSDKSSDELCHEKYCKTWEEGGYNDPPCPEYETGDLYPLTAGKSKYNAKAAIARQTLIDRGWKIEDGGQE